MATDYVWHQGESESQFYYDTYVGKDYLCVLANKGKPDLWFGFVNSRLLHDKTANDKQRKLEGLPMDAPLHTLRSISVLADSNPEYMMEKVVQCYTLGIFEIER